MKISSNLKKIVGRDEEKIDEATSKLSKPVSSKLKDNSMKQCNDVKLQNEGSPSVTIEQIKKITKDEVEYTNHDGIVIDQSDNILNFDEGNESPDSD